jgi:5-methylcytosine-specific restriction endonuclease McrA
MCEPVIISRKDAQATGLKRYFTGKPCAHGHITERYIWGQCIECERLRDASPERRVLHRQTDIAWRKNNPDRVSEKNRAQYLKNREKRLAHQSAYRAANPEQVREAIRRWMAQNSDYVRAYRKKYVAENREAFRFRNRARSARVRAAEGRFGKSDIERIARQQNNRCAYCRKSIKTKYEIDHIVPITKGGSNWPKNIQLTCESCNSRKSNKQPEQFARDLGLLI